MCVACVHASYIITDMHYYNIMMCLSVANQLTDLLEIGSHFTHLAFLIVVLFKMNIYRLLCILFITRTQPKIQLPCHFRAQLCDSLYLKIV